MGRRTTFELPGIQHAAPIPMAARVSNVLYSSAIMGADPTTGEVPDDPIRQIELVFANTADLLQLAGVDRDDIVSMNIYLNAGELRSEVNKRWLTWFPDPTDRPARHTTVHELPGNFAVQLQVVAVGAT
jgi:2-iminobutanoate/2-iminopropanoate deaminase